jgi:cyclohexadieny/prephenate dehydrogenase
MKPLFDRVTIIGFGLIGSSFARALSLHGLAGEIVCGDVSAAVCADVTELGLAARATIDLAQAVQGADLVMICAPVGSYAAIGTIIAPHLKPGAIISDVGSVKENVMNALAPLVPAGVHFVPGHPIAGGEKSGPRAGDGTIFKDRWCVLTPEANTDEQAIAKIETLWTQCGMHVARMDAAQHDRVLAITSHLPHLIAYTVVHTATELQDDTQADVIKFSAGGFRDFTRIAASDPVMWRDVFLNNREAVLEMLQRFTEDLTNLQKAIRRGDGETLEKTFAKARTVRRGVIDARQA